MVPTTLGSSIIGFPVQIAEVVVLYRPCISRVEWYAWNNKIASSAMANDNSGTFFAQHTSLLLFAFRAAVTTLFP